MLNLKLPEISRLLAPFTPDIVLGIEHGPEIEFRSPKHEKTVRSYLWYNVDQSFLDNPQADYLEEKLNTTDIRSVEMLPLPEERSIDEVIHISKQKQLALIEQGDNQVIVLCNWPHRPPYLKHV